MRRKNNEDDNVGISLLNKRLNNEKIDDSIIDEIMATDEDRKRAEKAAAKQTATENKKKESGKFKASSTSDSYNTSVMNNNNVMTDNDNTGAYTKQEPVTQEIPTPQPVQSAPQFIPQPTVQTTPTAQTGPVIHTVQAAQTEPTEPVSFGHVSYPVQDTYPQPQIQQSRRIIGISDDDYDDNDEDVIQNVINNTYNMFASDDENNTHAISKTNTSHNAPQPVQKAQPQVQAEPQIQYVEVAKVPVNKNRKRKKESLASRIVKKLLIYAAYIAIIGVFIWVVTTYIIGSVKMNGNSMEPTYYDKETLIVDKISINFKEPKSDDVIVFDKGETRYVARVAGVPGDKVAVDINGKVIVNDEYWNNTKESITQSVLNTDKEEEVVLTEKVSEIVLGKNEYFVMSDNELAPMDSRNLAIGIVTKKDIYGIVLLSFDFNKD